MITEITVDDGVATGWDADGQRVGQWEAGMQDYDAAGIEWPGCTCCAAADGRECDHGQAYYWGEMPTSEEYRLML